MEKKKLTKEEQMVKDAWEFVNCQVTASKLQTKRFTSLLSDDYKQRIYRISDSKEVHTNALIRLSELTGIPYNRVDWVGNKSCETNYDEVYFIYKGVKFFALVDKLEETEEK